MGQRRDVGPRPSRGTPEAHPVYHDPIFVEAALHDQGKRRYPSGAILDAELFKRADGAD